MRRRLALGLALAVLCAVPTSAGASVTVTEFKVEPSSTQGGGHPSVTITQAFDYGGTADSVKDAFVRLQPGLVGNPQAAALCSQEQFASDSCPADSKLGSVVVDALVYAVPLVGVPVTSNGTVYNLRPTGDEPARIGVVVEPTGGLEKLWLQAPVYLRPGPDGYGLESTFADQPRKAGAPLQIKRITLTLDGRASKGPFMRMPTSCAEGSSLTRANSWDAPAVFSERDFKVTPTGCESLPFAPTAEGALGAPGVTDVGEFPPFSTTLRFDPDHAALKRAEVILPQALYPNLAGEQRACPREAAGAGNCPDSSRVGTATIDSPLRPAPVRGPVYLAFNTAAQVPGLMVLLPAPVGVRIDGTVDAGNFGTRNTFASNPDLPVRSLSLDFEGGRADALLTIAQDLCSEKADTTMDVKLVAHNGKQVHFDQALATPGCDPRARVSIRRRGRTATLVARLKAIREGPGITGVSVKLPKALRRGRARPFVLADGQRRTPRTRRRSLTTSIGGSDGVRTATVAWPGLRANRRLRRSTRVTLSLKDSRGHTTTLKPRVRVRGKRPKRR